MKKGILFTALFLSLAFSPTAHAQTTSFTYQGSLNFNGAPANGNFDFEFAMFNPGNVQIGATVTLSNIPVANGVFSVALDFGDQFQGVDRLLEIRVRPAGGGAFTTLAPRQLITSAPYAVKSLTAETSVSATTAANALNLGGIPANQFVLTGDARLSDARNPLPGSANYIQNATTQQAASNFSISGTGAANIFNATTQYNLNGNRILSIAGTNNFFAGVAAGATNTEGVANAFFGTFAGGLNTSGGSNSFFGSSAGFSNTTGSENAFFGTSAGSSNTTGNLNSFVGSFAGFTNTTGSNNTFFGRQAGFNNSTANFNSFFGSAAGQNNTTGTRNSFFGASAGLANQLGNDNSFFGYEAGKNATVSTSNSFFGSQTGLNTSGLANSFFGSGTGTANTSGSSNSFFGRLAGGANSTGNNNSFFGRNSGFANTTGSENTFVGIATGDDNLTGSRNTLIGAFADVLFNNLSNAAAIGASAAVGQSNSLVLGSINGVNGSNSDTNVGIGTTTPTHRLTIGQPETPLNPGAKFAIYGADLADIILRDTTADVEGVFSANGPRVVIGALTSSELQFRTNNTGRMAIAPTGEVAINVLGTGGATSLCRNASNQISTCSSSMRYKSNINQFSPGLSLVKKLRPVSFDWKAGGMRDLGLVAEEVAAIEPLLTTQNEKGDTEGVKYDRVGVVLVNAVQEQQTQIEAQQKQIDGQNETIKRQQAEIETLKLKVSEIEALKKIVCSQNREADVCRPRN